MKTTQMPLEELIVGRYYVGRGRHANVGLWNGRFFLTIGEKFGRDVVMQEPYYTEDAGCFQPFRWLDEGIAIEIVDTRTGWDRHDARIIEFDEVGAKHQPLDD